MRRLRCFADQPDCELFGARLRNGLRTAGLGRAPTQDALIYSRWVWLRDDSSLQQIPVFLSSGSRWKEFKGCVEWLGESLRCMLGQRARAPPFRLSSIRAGAAAVISYCEVVAAGPPVDPADTMARRSLFLRSTASTCFAVGSPETAKYEDETPVLRWYGHHWEAVRNILQVSGSTVGG